jgi:hypothetical protein
MWWIDEQDVKGSAGGGGAARSQRWIDVGSGLPAAELPAHDGGKVSLADLTGRRHLVLFFYPRANTSG